MKKDQMKKILISKAIYAKYHKLYQQAKKEKKQQKKDH